MEITTGIPVSLAAPSIFTLYNAPLNLRASLVVAISQSAESTDTNLLLERAREQGALTVGITNEASSTLAKLAEHTFLVRYPGSCQWNRRIATWRSEEHTSELQ